MLGKLRRGHWSLQAELDLHGMTVDEAHDALADFLVDARNRGYRCVRVIHGKGLTSPGREPMLKGKVRKWLSHWDDVLAYAEAPRHAGGGGAVARPAQGRAVGAAAHPPAGARTLTTGSGANPGQRPVRKRGQLRAHARRAAPASTSPTTTPGPSSARSATMRPHGSISAECP